MTQNIVNDCRKHAMKNRDVVIQIFSVELKHLILFLIMYALIGDQIQ